MDLAAWKQEKRKKKKFRQMGSSQRTTHLMRLTNCREHQFLSACQPDSQRLRDQTPKVQGAIINKFLTHVYCVIFNENWILKFVNCKNFSKRKNAILHIKNSKFFGDKSKMDRRKKFFTIKLLFCTLFVAVSINRKVK